MSGAWLKCSSRAPELVLRLLNRSFIEGFLKFLTLTVNQYLIGTVASFTHVYIAIDLSELRNYFLFVDAVEVHHEEM